jgi:hypothetical protein
MRFVLRVGLILVIAAQPVFPQLGCPPASGRMISVSPEAKLHVIEWGGGGENVLFLSGLGASAHAFDDFARLFVDRFRVAGITRRGIPPSDSSTTGYNASQMTSDIVAVMDSLKIDRAHVVGWSFGGHEATNAFRPESLAYAAARNRARPEVPHARIVELLGAPHEVFAYSPEIIFSEMVAFFQRARSASR